MRTKSQKSKGTGGKPDKSDKEKTTKQRSAKKVPKRGLVETMTGPEGMTPDSPMNSLDSSDSAEASKAARLLLGQEVRYWRLKLGFTGARLSRQAGVSPGMLSKIEKGAVAPSIQTLMALAEGLNVPVTIFFSQIEKSRYVSYVPAGKGLAVDRRGTRGNHLSEMLGHGIGHVIGVDPFLMTLTDESEPFPYYQEDGLKFLYMLEGEMIYAHGARTFPLGPGDTLVFDAMSLHGPKEILKRPVRFLSVNVYSRFDPETR